MAGVGPDLETQGSGPGSQTVCVLVRDRILREGSFLPPPDLGGSCSTLSSGPGRGL